MACEVPNTLSDIPLPAATDYRVLYVGKGPSCDAVREFFDWGALATVNDTGFRFPDRRIQVSFCDRPWKLPFDRTGLALIPHLSIADKDRMHCLVTRWQFSGAMTEVSIREHIEKRQAAYFGTPAVSGVVSLWLMGYRQIWLFGHDGGVGVANGFEENCNDYSNRRAAIEYIQPLLRERGCDVRFWPEVF